MKTYLTNLTYLRIETDPTAITTLERKGWVVNPPPPYDPETQSATFDGEWHIVDNPIPEYTAEQWLDNQGFGSSRQPTLIYLKLQLDAANKTSTKLNTIQGFLNQILAEFVQDTTALRSDWTPAPYTFEETVQQALAVLQS